MTQIEKAGDDIESENARWTFGKGVAVKFDSHIEKSVPLYHEGHDLVCKLSDFFLSDGSICYEIGCSTGTLTCDLARRNKGRRVRFIGIDCEAEMIDEARRRNDNAEGMDFHCEDALDVEFEPCDLIVAYYTVQFVRPKNRQLLIDRFYNALNWGGALLLFEKVRAPDARFQDMMTSLYNDYKTDQGYTADNILAKNRSLKGVLEPFSTRGNLDLLERSGFKDVMTVMKYISFEGFLAIK